ncbi:MAG: PEP/pyruvate-binding domain-containing protein, partial [Candidatus Omnitrophota bacterium]
SIFLSKSDKNDEWQSGGLLKDYVEILGASIKAKNKAGKVEFTLYFPGPTSSSSPAAEKIRVLFEKLRKLFGGKGAWLRIIKPLAKKFGFSIPETAYISIAEGWAEFIKANQDLVNQGNRLVEQDIAAQGAVSDETASELKYLIWRFSFPEKLKELINGKVKDFEGPVIIRSSGQMEDNFERSLAGVFISPVKPDKRLAVQAVKEVFYQAIEVIWLEGKSFSGELLGLPPANNHSTEREIPYLLNEKEGIGLCIHPFLDFTVSGLVMTNYYGYNVIEAVVGDARTAVKAVQANAAQYLFKQGNGENFEFSTSFTQRPYEIILQDISYKADVNPAKMDEILKDYPLINGKVSPLKEEEARELNRVISLLDKEIGISLDIEWGFAGGKLYIIQVRPIIGDFRKPAVTMSAKLESKEPIARTMIAIGNTQPEGFSGKMVLFGRGADYSIIEDFEKELGEEYIRVQPNIASIVKLAPTKARVLVDVEQGSRLAHSVNRIFPRIDDGEFVYINGPVMRNGLKRSIDFIPHPVFAEVWVSRQRVVCFSDGIKAAIYLEEDDVQGKDKLSQRQEVLLGLHQGIDSLLLENNHNGNQKKGIEAILQLINNNILRKTMSLQSKLLIISMLSHPDEFILRSAEIYFKETPEVLEEAERLLSELEILKEAMNFPLYPPVWESVFMHELKRIFTLKNILKSFREASNIKSGGEEKLRLLLLDDDEGMLKTFTLVMQGYLDSNEYEIFTAVNYEEAMKILEENAINAVTFDLALNSLESRKIRENFYKLLEQIPFLAVVSGARDVKGEIENIIEKSGGGIDDSLISRVDVLHKPFSPEKLVEKIRGFRQRQLEFCKDGLKMQERPKKLKILWVDDDLNFISTVVEKEASDALGHKEYEISVEDAFITALEIAKEMERVDAVVLDLSVGRLARIYNSDTASWVQDKFAKILLKAPYILILSYFGVSAQRQETQEVWGREIAGKAKYIEKSLNRSDKVISALREFRQEQIKDYDKKSGRNFKEKEASTYDKPVVESILIIEPNATESRHIYRALQENFAINNFNVVTIDSMYNLDRALAQNTPVIVITTDALNGNSAEHAIQKLVRRVNPEAYFIMLYTGYMAGRQENFVAMEKPFYAQELFDALKERIVPLAVEKDNEIPYIEGALSPEERVKRLLNNPVIQKRNKEVFENDDWIKTINRVVQNLLTINYGPKDEILARIDKMSNSEKLRLFEEKVNDRDFMRPVAGDDVTPEEILEDLEGTGRNTWSHVLASGLRDFVSKGFFIRHGTVHYSQKPDYLKKRMELWEFAYLMLWAKILHSPADSSSSLSSSSINNAVKFSDVTEFLIRWGRNSPEVKKGLPVSLSEIVRETGITRQTIERHLPLANKNLRKLKHPQIILNVNKTANLFFDKPKVDEKRKRGRPRKEAQALILAKSGRGRPRRQRDPPAQDARQEASQEDPYQPTKSPQTLEEQVIVSELFRLKSAIKSKENFDDGAIETIIRTNSIFLRNIKNLPKAIKSLSGKDVEYFEKHNKVIPLGIAIQHILRDYIVVQQEITGKVQKPVIEKGPVVQEDPVMFKLAEYSKKLAEFITQLNYLKAGIEAAALQRVKSWFRLLMGEWDILYKGIEYDLYLTKSNFKEVFQSGEREVILRGQQKKGIGIIESIEKARLVIIFKNREKFELSAVLAGNILLRAKYKSQLDKINSQQEEANTRILGLRVVSDKRQYTEVKQPQKQDRPIPPVAAITLIRQPSEPKFSPIRKTNPVSQKEVVEAQSANISPLVEQPEVKIALENTKIAPEEVSEIKEATEDAPVAKSE